MRLRVVLVLWLGLFLLTFVAGCSRRVTDLEQVSPEEKIVIKFSHVTAENTPKGLAAKRFAELVKERTGGRVEVQVFPNSTLYKDGEELQALQAGAVQMIAPATAKLSGQFPAWQVFDLPFAFPDEEAVHRAMEGYIGKRLLTLLEENKVKGLAFWDNGFKQMTSNGRSLRKPEDFQGLSFRVMINSQVLKKQFERLGARPEEVPFNDLYSALEAGAVQGQENTISNICSKNLQKVQTHLTISNHGYLGYMVLTSSNFWAGLPEDIRMVLEGTLAEVTLYERELAAQMDREGLDLITASGAVEVHFLTSEEKREWMTAWRPLYPEFKNIIGEDILNALEEVRGDRVAR
ncbi:MAG: TRAP transporter substrate-binding protein [Firmicutes bacterium]|nr:TRAP transporter substrate-binding protein [Bacillota bacterium]